MIMLEANEIEDEEMFKNIFYIKTYCDGKKRCTDCEVGKELCSRIASSLLGINCDMSTLEIGRLSGRPICYTTSF